MEGEATQTYMSHMFSVNEPDRKTVILETTSEFMVSFHRDQESCSGEPIKHNPSDISYSRHDTDSGNAAIKTSVISLVQTNSHHPPTLMDDHKDKDREGNNPAEKIANEKPPIVEAYLQIDPDTRLSVFRQDFYVHSYVLKKHSKYFNRFLDSPDKQEIAVSSPFRYDYTTVIDEDGTWALEPATKAPLLTDETISKTDFLEREVECFRLLLCAIYNEPYTILNVNHLQVLTVLADFYCALPAVSATLTAALAESPIFMEREVDDNAPGDENNKILIDVCRMIFLAKRLRHATLFRECMVHIVANSKYDEIVDDYYDEFNDFRANETLRDLVISKAQTLRQNTMKIQMEIQDYLAKKSTNGSIGLRRTKFKEIFFEQSKPWLLKQGKPWLFKRHGIWQWANVVHNGLPAYFKNLSNRLISDRIAAPFAADLAKLVVSELVLDRTGFGAGEGPYSYCFLCVNVADDELPWDTDAKDW